jgi:3-isopropylmalate dehydrogenase
LITFSICFMSGVRMGVSARQDSIRGLRQGGVVICFAALQGRPSLESTAIGVQIVAHKVLILAGDGIGPEVIREAENVLAALVAEFGLKVECERALVGGAALDAGDGPLPESTLALARQCSAILFGAIGGPRWDGVERARRPESGLLALRSKLEFFANLRPVRVFEALVQASTLKPEVVSGLDLLIVRELTGGLYFGAPRGIEPLPGGGGRRGFNTMVYTEAEVERIARVAFEAARRRSRKVCSVDKANVLETSELWRDVVIRVARDFPDVAIEHMYVDNAAMQLVRAPGRFDVLLTENMFGDILSDLASMLSGSIGMLPSASLDGSGRGMYEPIHGSAPDIAGRGVANPLAAILSLAMLLRYSLHESRHADRVEGAVQSVLAQGLRTPDIHATGMRRVSTSEMGQAVVSALRKAA